MQPIIDEEYYYRFKNSTDAVIVFAMKCSLT